MQKNIFKFLSLFVALTCVFFFVKKMSSSKTSNPPEVHVEENYEQQLPDDFHSFYDKFHTDSIFQLERTQFPLKGLTQSSDSTKVADEILWQKEDWQLHRPFDNQGGTFERTFSNLQGIVSEYISANNGLFSLEKRYAKLAGKWHLIYYQEMIMHG